MLRALLFFVLLAGTSIAAPPDIVYINVDDLGWADLGCQGSTYYETPNIDRLAKEGMRFTDAYAPAANCVPSRASCMTGQYPPRHGIYTVSNPARGEAKDRGLVVIPNRTTLRPGTATLGNMLQAAGYRTGTFGKWHLSDDPREFGFEVNVAGGSWGSPSKGGYHSPYDYPNCTAEEKGEYLTDRITEEAVRFLKEDDPRPVFLYLPYYAVHTPLQAKEELQNHFREKDSNMAHDNATYAAMIATMDAGVGRIMHALEETGRADNALVIFTSDNGGLWRVSRQWPLRAGKGSYYEGGIRVPFIVRWPGQVEAGATNDTPVSGIDLLPTLEEVTEAAIPDALHVDGANLAGVLKGEASLATRPLFWHFPIYLERGGKESRDPGFRTRPGSVMREGDWKLHEYFEDGALELYNLAEDPGEKENLVTQHPDRAARMHAELLAWRIKTGARVPNIANPEFDGE